MPVVTRGPLLTLYWKLHRTLFRLSSGRIGARSGDWPVLLLTTKGQKTGERRDVALNYLRDDGSYVVIGSFAGADRHPAWWKNLRASCARSMTRILKILFVRTSRESNVQAKEAQC